MVNFNNEKNYTNPSQYFLETTLYQMPAAYAKLQGNPETGEINGIVRFYSVGTEVLVNAEVYGLPIDMEKSDIFGFHIHEGTSCSGNKEDPYADAKQHFNPTLRSHPAHAGDMPPLFGNNGFAWMLYLTNRFTIEEILGRTIILHAQPDDFSTQPSGNSGAKIACGIIQAV